MEKLRIEPDRLEPELLKYECRLRSVDYEGRPAKDTYAELKHVLDAEYSGEADMPDPPLLTFEQAAAEIQLLAADAQKMRAGGEALEVSRDGTMRRKLRSCLAHFYGRLQRFFCNVPDLLAQRDRILAHMEVSCARIVAVRPIAAAPRRLAEVADGGADDAGPSDERQPSVERQAEILAELSDSMAALGDPAADLAALSRGQASLKFPPSTKFYVAVGYDESTQSHFPINDDGSAPPFSARSAPQKHKFQMHSWKLEFSGECDGKMSLSEFLERVEWKKRENGMSDSDLLCGAHNLFTGAALNWFKANRIGWTKFQDLRDDLIRHFRSADYEDRIWEQLRLRSQAKDERLNLYVCDMMTLFELLETPPSEGERLKFIKARLNPFAWQHIRDLPGIATVSDLIAEGLRLEVVKSRIDNYRPPSAPDNPIEPSLAPKGHKQAHKVAAHLNAVSAQKKRGAPVDAVASVSASGGAIVMDGGGAPAVMFDSAGTNFVPGAAVPNKAFLRKQNEQRVCWNCDKQGHIFRFCPVKRANMFCWSCGKKGVTKSGCTELCRRSKNLQGGPARGQTLQGAPVLNVDGMAPSGSAT